MIILSAMTVAGHSGIAFRPPTHAAPSLTVELLGTSHGGRIHMMRDFLATIGARPAHAGGIAAARERR